MRRARPLVATLAAVPATVKGDTLASLRHEQRCFDRLPEAVRAAMNGAVVKLTPSISLEKLRAGWSEERLLDYLRGVKAAAKYVPGTNVLEDQLSAPINAPNCVASRLSRVTTRA